MFCVECGSETAIYRNGLCVPCYIKNITFAKGPRYIDIYMCPVCQSYKYKNTWLPESFDQILLRYITTTYKIKSELNNLKITPTCTHQQKTIQCNIKISGTIQHHKVEEHHHTIIRQKNLVCNICSKQHGGYYEAILQIRSSQKKLSEKQLQQLSKDIQSYVAHQQEKGNRGLFITDIAREHGGLDFYFSEKGVAATLSKRIQDHYGGEIKQSSSNVGMKDGRQLYRMTYLIRLPPYTIGDIIKIKKSYIQIQSISGQKIHGIDLTSWTETSFDVKEIEHATLFELDQHQKEMQVISQTQKEIQLMDPKTYRIIDLKKPQPYTFSEKAQTVLIEDTNLLLPYKEKKRKK